MDSPNGPSGTGAAPLERELLLADSQIPLVHNLRDDVDAVGEVKVDEIGLAILDFVNRRFFLGAALDVGEFLVVIDRGDGERRVRGLGAVAVVEGEPSGIL